MTSEERIAELERELAQLRANFVAYGLEHQRILGEAQGFETAVKALLDLYPDRPALWAVLSPLLAQADAECVARSNTEERLQGLQAVQQLLTELYGNSA